MQFILSRTDLLNKLQAVKSVIQSKNTNPILDNFLFDINDGKLLITGSTGETTMQAEMQVENAEPALFAVPAEKLVDTLKNLPEQPLTFQLDENLLRITAENGKYSLPVYPGEDFPQPPALDDPFEREISGSQLAEAVSKTIFAAGNDEMRPVLNGLLFHFKPEGLNLVATDSHKLVKFTVKNIYGDGQEYILPQKPSQILKNLLGSDDEPVKLRFNEKAAEISFSDFVLTTTLIMGKYPNYELVIPKENPYVLIANRELLLQALKRTAIYASKSTHLVRLDFKGSQLTILARNEEMASEAIEKLNVNYKGEDISIGFNARSLVDMLGHLDSEEVEITMSAPNRAVLISPLDGLNENEEIVMLLMPIAY
jgi:DNA polymerase-3 subunit beta